MQVVVLLVTGGLLYIVAVALHRARIPFQAAVWHAFVLAGRSSEVISVEGTKAVVARLAS